MPGPEREKESAIGEILKRFGGERVPPGMDTSGRLIAADERLLAIHLMASADRRYANTVGSLTGLVNDYKASISSVQRLFLMEELRMLQVPTGLATAIPKTVLRKLWLRWVCPSRTRLGGLKHAEVELRSTWSSKARLDKLKHVLRVSRIGGKSARP